MLFIRSLTPHTSTTCTTHAFREYQHALDDCDDIPHVDVDATRARAIDRSRYRRETTTRE